MRRKNIEQKQTSPKLKEERKRISDSINIEKRNLEDLKKEIKMADKILEERQGFLLLKQQELYKIEKDIKSKINDEAKISVDLVYKKEEFKKQIREAEIEEQRTRQEIEKIKQEQAQSEKERKEAVEDKNKELEGLEANLEGLKERERELMGKCEGSEEEIKEYQERLDGLIVRVQEKEKEENVLNETIEELIPQAEKVKQLKEEEKQLRQSILVCQGEVEQTRRELAGVVKEKEARLTEVIKRESAVEKREEQMKITGEQLKGQKKRIEVMGNTLQKHLDRYGMKHIKVF